MNHRTSNCNVINTYLQVGVNFSENGGRRILRNIGKYLTECTESHFEDLNLLNHRRENLKYIYKNMTRVHRRLSVRKVYDNHLLRVEACGVDFKSIIKIICCVDG
jgi:hypothetical protein